MASPSRHEIRYDLTGPSERTWGSSAGVVGKGNASVKSRSNAVRIDHPVIITFLLLAIIAFLYFAAAFLKPLALAILLSFALAPVAAFLERKLPRAPSVILTVVCGIGLLFVIALVVWNQIGSLSDNIDTYTQNIERHFGKMKKGDTQPTALEKLNKLWGEGFGADWRLRDDHGGAGDSEGGDRP